MVEAPDKLRRVAIPGAPGAWSLAAPWSMALLLATGCYQGADLDGDDGATGPGSAGTPGSGDAGEAGTPTSGATDTADTADTVDTADTADTTDTADTGAEADGLPQTSRYPRLSHTQWENSVQDLLSLPEPTGFSKLFIGDPISGGFDNNSEALKVTATLWTDYQRGAEAVADLVAGNPDILAKVAPASEGDSDAQARAFITAFGKRAYRRPLTTEEIDRHVQIFQSGVSTPGTFEPFAAGVRLVVQAMLQSPFFLYRIEATDVEVDGKIKLGEYELASKLSYMLWNTMPDDELFAAADAKLLQDPAGLSVQATRMLEDSRAHAMVGTFHHQLLHVDHYSDIYKDPNKFPNYDPAMNAMMATETRMFVEDVVFGQDGDLATLLTAPYSFVNDKLAALYGVAAPAGPEFARVDLDPAQRAGILTQVGFLSANAGAFENDIIHRGVFMNLQLICSPLPPPPNMVPPLPPPVEGESLRERVNRHTGEGTCGAGCHGGMINPLGFAFENYGPLGQWQTMDAGKPVDAAAAFEFKDGVKPYDGAVQLAQLMAESPDAHRCYVAHLLEYGYARGPQKADDTLIQKVADASQAGTLSIKQMILELTRSEAFMYRAPVEG